MVLFSENQKETIKKNEVGFFAANPAHTFLICILSALLMVLIEVPWRY